MKRIFRSAIPFADMSRRKLTEEIPGTSRRDKPSAAIVRADHIGDLVLTTPMIRALAKAGWNVDVIAPPIINLLEGNPCIREWYNLHTISSRWPADWWQLALFLRKRKYDVIILPYAHPRHLLFASALSGARQRIAMWGGIPGRLTGHKCVRSGFLEKAQPYARTILRALSPLGIPAEDIHPELFPTDAEIRNARITLNKHLCPGIRVGIHPICLGNTCNLPISEYGALTQRILAETEWSVVITGAPGDIALLKNSNFPTSSFKDRLWVACGEFNLRELAALFTQLDCIVVPSTGPLHIAHAVGTPTVTPFCPQIPVCKTIWGHEPPLAISIEPKNSPCNPGNLHGPHCDFHGSITATELFEKLLQQVNAVSNADTPRSTGKSGGA